MQVALDEFKSSSPYASSQDACIESCRLLKANTVRLRNLVLLFSMWMLLSLLFALVDVAIAFVDVAPLLATWALWPHTLDSTLIARGCCYPVIVSGVFCDDYMMYYELTRDGRRKPLSAVYGQFSVA